MAFSKRPMRRSALIGPWGVGAIVPFPNDEALMIAGLDAWRYNDSKPFVIKDARLTKRLGVSELRWPPDFRENNADPQNCNLRIPTVRFPTWYYCPFCGQMKQTTYYETQPQCDAIQWKEGRKCSAEGKYRKKMIPERFIVVCPQGHIDDFPVAEWVHHDSGPTDGYTVSREHVVRDLTMMKKNNINAIRTSHYPNAPWFTELCNEYGFYVIAEADFETHGTMDLVGEEPIYRKFGKIVQDPAFHDAIVDRMMLNVIRDKNASCVVIWSLGNESGYGKNLIDAGKWTKEYDPTRPVHYEGATWAPPGIENDQSCLDMVSRMYPTVETIKKYLADPTSVKPFILCEFVHAMGNGPGDIEDYLEVILPEKRIIGAFVWEWCDHATYEGKTPDGKDKYFYGGDYGEFPHDGNFCMDGLVYSDRRPHTGLHEWKNAIRPVRATLQEISPLKVSLWNRLDFTNLDDAVTVTYEIKEEGRLLSQGSVAVPSIEPHEKGFVLIPETPKTNKNTYLKLTYTAKQGTALAGEVLGFDQIALFEEQDEVLTPVSKAALPSFASWSVNETADVYELTRDGECMVFDRHLGTFAKIVKDNENQISEPMRFLTFRAPTNNDRQYQRSGEWQDTTEAQ